MIIRNSFRLDLVTFQCDPQLFFLSFFLLLAYLYILAPQDALRLLLHFSCHSLGIPASPRDSDFFYWRISLEMKIWTLDILIDNELALLLDRLNVRN